MLAADPNAVALLVNLMHIRSNHNREMTEEEALTYSGLLYTINTELRLYRDEVERGISDESNREDFGRPS